ncbi:hypothetical protein [Granulicella mallensis]|uniref:Uncharacterized protein n=1 Tax=Granulicella mallensis (strain ATCC BAA-1857 / DSM 23137 / MP5ACTX8) TaxID=682795 RepID=G8NQP4_GRAMM|nr:hypothetical protein [Granulicella mallensis]AEU37270.1 hypothetical protein AciX8_2967 [Granulicella mallensis MP5ACTX8]
MSMISIPYYIANLNDSQAQRVAVTPKLWTHLLSHGFGVAPQ